MSSRSLRLAERRHGFARFPHRPRHSPVRAGVPRLVDGAWGGGHPAAFRAAPDALVRRLRGGDAARFRLEQDGHRRRLRPHPRRERAARAAARLAGRPLRAAAHPAHRPRRVRWRLRAVRVRGFDSHLLSGLGGDRRRLRARRLRHAHGGHRQLVRPAPRQGRGGVAARLFAGRPWGADRHSQPGTLRLALDGGDLRPRRAGHRTAAGAACPPSPGRERRGAGRHRRAPSRGEDPNAAQGPRPQRQRGHAHAGILADLHRPRAGAAHCFGDDGASGDALDRERELALHAA